LKRTVRAESERGPLAHTNEGFGVRDELLASLALHGAASEELAVHLPVGAPWDLKAKVAESMVQEGLVVRISSGEVFLGATSYSRSGYQQARAVLKTRYLLGLRPSPCDSSLGLQEPYEVAAALLLLTYFSRTIGWLPAAAGLFTQLDLDPYELIGHLMEEGLVGDELADLRTCELHECTPKGKKECQAWLAMREPGTWPVRLLPRANRRLSLRCHPAVLPPDIGLGSLQSDGLEKLAADYARRKLRLQNVQLVGGKNDGGRDVIGYDELGRLFVVQAKATAESSLSRSSLAHEEERLNSDSGKPVHSYLVLTNAKAPTLVRRRAAEIGASVSAESSGVVAKAELESFLRADENRDLLLVYCPHLAPFVSSGDSGAYPRRANEDGGEACWRMRSILSKEFAGTREGARFIARDLEYDDRDWLSGDLPHERVGWRKEFHSLGDNGLNYLCGPRAVRTIPFENAVLLDPFLNDGETGLVHLFITNPESVPGLLERRTR